jgi:hypothetical protein
LFVGVEAGQLLATRIPATTGIAGINVFGKEVAQTLGKDMNIKMGEDVLFNEQTGEIHAAVGGVLTVVNESAIKVTSRYVVAGDIDFRTGNLDSGDAVEISGSIRPGFAVTTGGNLLVGGTVESARLVSRGNIVVRGGMMGKDAQIEAEGDVECPVVWTGIVTGGGTVRISREVYNAEIRASRDIVLTEKARVVSSDLLAGGSINVMEVDTETSPNSLLAAATLPERFVRYQKLLREYHLAQAAVNTWHRRFGAAADNDDLDELLEEFEDARKSLATYNLIPGVGERDRTGALRYACRQRITVQGTIRVGAVIRIGNVEVTLKKNYCSGYFSLNGEKGLIEFRGGGGIAAGMVEEI